MDTFQGRQLCQNDIVCFLKRVPFLKGGGWVRQRCCVFCITRGVQLILAYSWARPAVLAVGKGREGKFYFFFFFTFIPVPHSSLTLFFSSLSFLFLFLPCPSLSSPLLSLLSLFSLSLGNDTKWPTSVDVSSRKLFAFLCTETIDHSSKTWTWPISPRMDNFQKSVCLLVAACVTGAVWCKHYKERHRHFSTLESKFSEQMWGNSTYLFIVVQNTEVHANLQDCVEGSLN